MSVSKLSFHLTLGLCSSKNSWKPGSQKISQINLNSSYNPKSARKPSASCLPKILTANQQLLSQKTLSISRNQEMRKNLPTTPLMRAATHPRKLVALRTCRLTKLFNKLSHSTITSSSILERSSSISLRLKELRVRTLMNLVRTSTSLLSCLKHRSPFLSWTLIKRRISYLLLWM